MAKPFLETVLLNSGYLNGGGETLIGKSVSPDSLPSTDYAGLLGKMLIVDDAEALKLSLTSTGTLRQGVYQLVKTKAGTTAAPARGIACFWDTNANAGPANKVVTPDISATIISSFAGIYVDVPAKGEYCWIQVAGLATLLCRSAVTTTTIGDLAVFTGLTTNTFDSIADATDFFTTAGTQKLFVGHWHEAPANDGLKLAWLKHSIAGYFV